MPGTAAPIPCCTRPNGPPPSCVVSVYLLFVLRERGEVLKLITIWRSSHLADVHQKVSTERGGRNGLQTWRELV